MAKTPHIFTGAGNNFVVFDGREGGMDEYRRPERIQALCREYCTDGLMILTEAPGQDFGMEFYNPDGSGGMMCGNGGRCIVAFADYLGLKPASEDGTWHFLAPDGEHTATILDRAHTSKPSLRDPSHPDGWAPPSYAAEGGHGFGGISPAPKWAVRLKMIDVKGISKANNGYFLNTGTRHYVEFRDNVDAIDIEPEAKPIRWADEFQPEGTNVNFVEKTKEGLKVRTFEKGVEGETLACGTGLTASAIAAFVKGIAQSPVRLQCRRGDWLEVEFTHSGDGFKDVFLTGPAELIEK
ncbi:MAG: diaminopimelate epimerase [Bacteroidales bacterium]|nr:diaminopimelate epimerase [Bacteroidales bacterium]